MARFAKHRWWILTALLTAPLVAIAAGVPNMFAPNTTISSAAVNANFTNLADRVTALEAALARTKPTVVIDAAPGVSQPTTIIKTGTFTSMGGTVILTVSGSGYVGANPPSLLMDLSVQLDGNVIGHLKEYTNETGSHKAFPTRSFVLAGLAAGSHTVGLLQTAPMTSDGNDFFTVTVIELPS
jgi:hypothetical protein